MTIGEIIKKARKEKKLTQKELGDLLGRTQRTIQAYEKDEVIPPLNILDKISNILDISMSNLINGKTLDEKKENIEKIPSYDEFDLEKFALNLNIDYSKIDEKSKEEIKEVYDATSDIYKTMLGLTETDKYIYSFNEYIHGKAPLFKILSVYQIENLYKKKIKDLKDRENYFLEQIKDYEKMSEYQKEIINLQKKMITNLEASNTKEGE